MKAHTPPTTNTPNPSRETPPVSTASTNPAPNSPSTDPPARPTVVVVDELHELHEHHAQQLLSRAADRLERHGWRRSAYWPDSYVFAPYVEGDPCCALGALVVADGIATYEAANWALTARPALALAVDALAAEINRNADDRDHVVDVADWNDDPGRTATEVITAMRAAADRLAAPVDPAAVLTAFGDLFTATGINPGMSASALSGAPSAKNAHQAGPASPNHQRTTSEEPTDD